MRKQKNAPSLGGAFFLVWVLFTVLRLYHIYVCMCVFSLAVCLNVCAELYAFRLRTAGGVFYHGRGGGFRVYVPVVEDI